MRKKIVGGNWKMNLTLQEAVKLTEDIIAKVTPKTSDIEVLLCVPFPYLSAIQSLIKDIPHFSICSQNMSAFWKGAYTGEVSAQMLLSMDIKKVMIGHSERRLYYGETNEIVAQKIELACAHKITPILCCGETLDIRKKGLLASHIHTQLLMALANISKEDANTIIFAYEPVWAIGTGKSASPAEADQALQVVRNTLAQKYDQAFADNATVLYGGSVNENNAKVLFQEPNIDGGLVGNAALNADQFVQILESFS